MFETPDIIGYPLEEALEICKKMGYETEILITRPVKSQPDGIQRVVNFNRVSTNKGVLIVVFEDKGRGGG